jgi:hypothetical protein
VLMLGFKRGGGGKGQGFHYHPLPLVAVLLGFVALLTTVQLAPSLQILPSTISLCGEGLSTWLFLSFHVCRSLGLLYARDAGNEA